MFKVLRSRNHLGTRLPSRRRDHIQRSETGKLAAGQGRTHQDSRLWSVQGGHHLRTDNQDLLRYARVSGS